MEKDNNKLNVIISNNKDYEDVIRKGIRKFNEEKHPENEIFKIYREKGYGDDFGFYAILNGEIIGGIIAHKKMQWLDIDILFVNQDLIGMHLYTLDFQAKGFYEKQKFNLIAEIKDWPKGITRYEFIRYINN